MYFRNKRCRRRIALTEELRSITWSEVEPNYRPPHLSTYLTIPSLPTFLSIHLLSFLSHLSYLPTYLRLHVPTDSPASLLTHLWSPTHLLSYSASFPPPPPPPPTYISTPPSNRPPIYPPTFLSDDWPTFLSNYLKSTSMLTNQQPTYSLVNKGGLFLKKLWCCVCGRV